LPPGEGAEAGRRLRAALSDRNVPIILMVPEGRRSECVCPEDGGPDECIAKPFGIADLVSRLRSATQQKPSRRGTKVLSFADVTVDLTARRVLRGGRAVHLGPTEFRLLWFFMEHPYKVFSRSSLLKAIRGSDVGFDFDLRTVDVYVRRLRKSLNVDGSANIIRTVRTAGYSMDIEAGAGLGR
jgi:two-component system phosphate regulon response regulator PhoB